MAAPSSPDPLTALGQVLAQDRMLGIQADPAERLLELSRSGDQLRVVRVEDYSASRRDGTGHDQLGLGQRPQVRYAKLAESDPRRCW